MGAPLPRDLRCSTSVHVLEEPQSSTRKWYFSCQEIEECSPSRKDGINLEKEVHLRKSYCSFLQTLGVKLNMPQVAIACAMMLCHRFFMRQSHAKNDWQTIATVGIFLAGKVEETPRLLQNVVTVAYEMIYHWDPSAPQKIRQREVYDKQKELIVVGERLLLATIAYDLNIELPYNPLVAALKRLKIHPDLPKIAWNFINDWLFTTLCLQYKPHYIAAGSLFLAAKFQKVKLPMEKGKVWWWEFDISPKQLEEVVQQMLKLLEQDRKQGVTSANRKPTQIASARKTSSIHSLQPCISSGSNPRWHSSNGVVSDELGKSLGNDGRQPCVKYALPSQTSDSGSSAVLEDCDDESHPRTEKSVQKHHCRIVSSRAHDQRQVEVKKVLSCQARDGATNGSTVEDSKGDSKLITAISDPDTSIKNFSVYHTSSKINACQIGETLKKRKGVSDRSGNRPLGEAKKRVLRL
ncbi:hypothetical protein SLA2020_309210 [Shorea laevis]